MENVVKQGPNVIKAHLSHLKDHGQTEYFNQAVDYLKENDIDNPLEVEEHAHHDQEKETLPCGCPGSAVMDMRGEEQACSTDSKPAAKGVSELKQWPVQIMLVPSSAPYLKDADLLIAADCVPFAYPDFHSDFLKGKILLIGCPKLDDAQFYKEKITQIFKDNNIKSVTIAHMEVPCCFGLVKLVEDAIRDSGKEIPLKDYTIGVKGDIKE